MGRAGPVGWAGVSLPGSRHVCSTQQKSNFLGPEKPFVKFRSAYALKLVFSYVVKGIKIKITAKFCASRRLSSEDTKIIMSLEMSPKSFGTFGKQAPARLAEIPGSRCRDPG